MIASDKALNAALAQSDAALAKIPGGMASVSKSLLDGYGAGQQFEALIRRINNAADRGMGLDRVNLLLDAAYRKFGLTADAANLAATGYVSITAAVKELNEQYEIQNEVAARAAAAMAQVSTAAAAQSSINARLGVGGGSGKSAQESADAFLAQFGGLEGIARAKAQEAGNAFAADLDARMVAGAGKSARDSANAFDAELSRLDEIAGMRAQQAGTNFQRSLTEALGGGGGSATSRGATFSALEEQFNRLEAIAAAKSTQIAQATQQGLRDAFRMDTRATDYQLPDAFGKTNVATVSALEEMAKAEEKAAAQAAALRAEINPLEAEMVKLGKQMAEYRKMLDQGLISSSEFEQAQGMAAKRLSDVDMNMRDAATGGRVLSGEMANLGYQVNDVVTGLMLGQPLFMIAAQQGGQVYQIFSRSKASVGEFAGSYLSSLTSMVTPTRAVFGGIAAVVTTAAIALNSYLDKQHQVSMSLLGSGRGSGANAAGINGIANAAATPNGLSVSEAREFASTLVQTGKIANDNLLPIVQIGKDITRIYGIDATEAAKMLADAFADPEKGATELNNRLGFLDAGMKRNIDNLVAQNKLFDAQKALLAGVKSGLTGVSEAVSTSSTVWTVLGNAVSNAWDATGAFIAKQIGLTDSLEEKIARARQNLDELRRGGSNTQNAMSAATGFGDILGIARTPRIRARLQPRKRHSIGSSRSSRSWLRLRMSPRGPAVLPPGVLGPRTVARDLRDREAQQRLHGARRPDEEHRRRRGRRRPPRRARPQHETGVGCYRGRSRENPVLQDRLRAVDQSVQHRAAGHHGVLAIGQGRHRVSAVDRLQPQREPHRVAETGRGRARLPDRAEAGHDRDIGAGARPAAHRKPERPEHPTRD